MLVTSRRTLSPLLEQPGRPIAPRKRPFRFQLRRDHAGADSSSDDRSSTLLPSAISLFLPVQLDLDRRSITKTCASLLMRRRASRLPASTRRSATSVRSSPRERSKLPDGPARLPASLLEVTYASASCDGRVPRVVDDFAPHVVEHNYAPDELPPDQRAPRQRLVHHPPTSTYHALGLTRRAIRTKIPQNVKRKKEKRRKKGETRKTRHKDVTK